MGSVVPPRERCVSLQCGQSPSVLYPFCVTPEAPESSDSRPSSPSNGPIRKTVTVVKEVFACFLLFSLNQWGYPEARGGWSSTSQEWHAAPSEKPRVALGRAARSWEQNKIFPMSSPFPRSLRHLTETPMVLLQGIIRLQVPRSAVTKFNMSYCDYNLKSQEIYISSQGLIALCCGSPTPTPPPDIFSHGEGPWMHI